MSEVPLCPSHASLHPPHCGLAGIDARRRYVQGLVTCGLATCCLLAGSGREYLAKVEDEIADKIAARRKFTDESAALRIRYLAEVPPDKSAVRRWCLAEA